jgi:hypothetical protein
LKNYEDLEDIIKCTSDGRRCTKCSKGNLDKLLQRTLYHKVPDYDWRTEGNEGFDPMLWWKMYYLNGNDTPRITVKQYGGDLSKSNLYTLLRMRNRIISREKDAYKADLFKFCLDTANFAIPDWYNVEMNSRNGDKQEYLKILCIVNVRQKVAMCLYAHITDEAINKLPKGSENPTTITSIKRSHIIYYQDDGEDGDGLIGGPADRYAGLCRWPVLPKDADANLISVTGSEATEQKMGISVNMAYPTLFHDCLNNPEVQ